MISKSVYLQEVIARHPFSYVTRLFAINPTHIIGLLFGASFLFLLIHELRVFVLKTPTGACNHRSSNLQLGVFILWPISFLAGLTLIGLLGGGYQIRFLLPILPATSILTAICICSCGNKVLPLLNILQCYGSFHILYYSILYPPILADFDITVLDILEIILKSPLEADSMTKEALLPIYKYMRHFGLAMKI